jgi:acetoin utilization deacetylase AcuC-like enzyme
MRTVVITSQQCDLHQTGGHVEAVQRRLAIMAHLAEAGMLAGRSVLEATAAGNADLERVHAPRYVRAIGELARAGGGWLDYDTVVTPGSDDAARAAAGAALLAVDQALSAARRALAVIRPPGHHALAARGMGFCLYNNIAVAAAYARARHGLERVLIVDWDVHHGNGTQALFERDPGVCSFSIHQSPHYPGTGLAEEMGEGPGRGTTINVPVPAGTGDAGYARALREVLAPVARRYRPELVLVSAGFDAHADDPLGGTRVTTAGFAALTRQVVALAGELCDGRVAFVLEGGYNLHALARSVEAMLRASDDPAPTDPPPSPSPVDDRLVDGVIARVRQLHGLRECRGAGVPE